MCDASSADAILVSTSAASSGSREGDVSEEAAAAAAATSRTEGFLEVDDCISSCLGSRRVARSSDVEDDVG